MYVCTMYVCMYICRYVCMYACMHLHTNTHTVLEEVDEIKYSIGKNVEQRKFKQCHHLCN